MAERLERLDTCSTTTGVGAVMAVWIARFGNRAMAGMFPVKDKRDGSRCRRLSRRQSERKSVFLGAAKVKRPSRWSTGWTKAGEVAKVGVGAQCWAGWADMCVPTRVFEGGCGAGRALQRPVYQCASKVGVPCPWGARDTKQRVLPFGAPRSVGYSCSKRAGPPRTTGCRCPPAHARGTCSHPCRPCRKATCLSATILPLSSQRALCFSTLTHAHALVALAQIPDHSHQAAGRATK